MPENRIDKMVCSPQQGFGMYFFDVEESQHLQISELSRYVPGAQYREGMNAANYHCQILQDTHGRTILMKGKHSVTGHVLVSSQFRPLELSIIFANVPNSTRSLINLTIKNHLPNANALSKEWVKSNFSNALLIEDIDEDHLFQLGNQIVEGIPNFTPSKNPTLSPDNAFYILQGECGITRHDADHPILGTANAGPCVILSVYNERAKQGFLSHIDDRIDLNAISCHIFEMRRNTDQPLVAHMAGAWSDTYYFVADIALRLQEQPNTKIKGWNQPNNLTTELALDTRDGQVYQKVVRGQFCQGPMIDEREQSLGSFVTAAAFGTSSTARRPPLPVYRPETGANTVLAYKRS